MSYWESSLAPAYDPPLALATSSLMTAIAVAVLLTSGCGLHPNKPDGSGTIEFTEASTELVVPSGRPVVLGGATTQMHEVTRQILGFRQSQAGSETTVVLIATVQ